MATYCMTFVPLSSLSPDAGVIQAQLREYIEAGIQSGKYSRSLQKQYRILLDNMKDEEPECEVVLSQRLSTKPSNIFVVSPPT